MAYCIDRALGRSHSSEVTERLDDGPDGEVGGATNVSAEVSLRVVTPYFRTTPPQRSTEWPCADCWRTHIQVAELRTAKPNARGHPFPIPWFRYRRPLRACFGRSRTDLSRLWGP